MRTSMTRSVVMAAAAVTFGVSAHAATVTKANNTTALNDTMSWIGGVIPGSGDVAQWDSTVTAANAVLLGQDLNWQGISIINPSGAVTLNAGNTLSLGSSGVKMLTATQDLTIAAGLALTADQTWQIASSRTLTVSSAATNSSAITFQGPGTIKFTNTALNFGGSIDFARGGALNYSPASAGAASLGALSFSGGDATVTSTRGGSTGNTSLSIVSLGARAAGATVNFSLSGGTNGSTNKIVLGGVVTGAMDVGMFYAGSNYAWYDAGGYVRGLNYGVDANTVALTGAATTMGSVTGSNVRYTGSSTTTFTSTAASGVTVITPSSIAGLAVGQLLTGTGIAGGTYITAVDSGAGTVTLSQATSGAVSGTITPYNLISAQTTQTLRTLKLEGATNGSVWLAANEVLTVSGILRSGTNNTNQYFRIGGTGTAAVKALADGELAIRTDGGNDILAIDVPILANGANALTKSGSGLLILSKANTYTGVTTVARGTLRLGDAASLGTTDGGTVVHSGGQLDLRGKTVSGESLTLNGGSLYNSGGGSPTWSGAIVLGELGGSVAGLDWQNTLTITGNITGVGGLRQNGNGDSKVYLKGTNTYTGPTSTSDWSSLYADNGSAIGDLSAVSISANGKIYIRYASETIGSLAGSGPMDMGNQRVTTGGNNTSTTYTGVLSNGAFTKAGSGVFTTTRTHTYTGSTIIDGGVLVVNGSIATSSGVTVNALGTLSGSGIVSKISGAGLVSPGSSPGILTTTQIDAAAGTDFAFEFTSTGSPDYATPTASVNDVLHVTSATPFLAALGSANAVNVYLGVATLTSGDTFKGGWYVDSAVVDTQITGATFNYFVKGDGLGTTVFNGQNYYALAAFDPGASVAVNWINETDLQFGTIDGSVTQFVVSIPEPASVAMAGLMSVAILGGRRRRVA